MTFAPPLGLKEQAGLFVLPCIGGFPRLATPTDIKATSAWLCFMLLVFGK